MTNSVKILTSCDTYITISENANGLVASFYNEGDDGNLVLFGEITNVTLGWLMEDIKEYAQENEIDLY